MKLLTLFSILLLFTEVKAQTQMLNTTRDQINVNGLRIPTTGTLWGVSSSDQGTVTGQTYLDTTWAQGNLKLFQSIQPVGGKAVDTLSGLAMRYNVFFNEIEILMNTYRDVKALKGDKVKSFSVKDRVFLNTSLYETEKLTPGFFELLVPGALPLVSFPRTLVKKPTYTAAFEVGNKDTRILMEEDFYVLRGNKAEKVKSTKKGILELLDDKNGRMAAYLKVNSLDLKDRSNLIRVFREYNTQ